MPAPVVVRTLAGDDEFGHSVRPAKHLVKRACFVPGQAEARPERNEAQLAKSPIAPRIGRPRGGDGGRS
jgi:hypothetical protein